MIEKIDVIVKFYTYSTDFLNDRHLGQNIYPHIPVVERNEDFNILTVIRPAVSLIRFRKSGRPFNLLLYSLDFMYPHLKKSKG